MKICLSGAEHHKKLFDFLLQQKVPNLLLSFYYLNKRKDKGRELLELAKNNNVWVMIDGGGNRLSQKFCFLHKDTSKFTENELNKAYNENSMSDKDIDKYFDGYLDEYISWLIEFVDLYDIFNELDIDHIIESKIWDWRQKLENIPKAQTKLCITPHLYKEWNKLIKQYPYIGLEGGLKELDITTFFAHNLNLLREYGVRIHGWAQTNVAAIQKIPFFSVSSSSWLLGGQYGLTYNYEAGCKISSLSKKEKAQRIRFKQRCEDLNISHEKLMDDDRMTVNFWNASQWIKYAQELNNYTINNYWSSKKEKTSKKLQKTLPGIQSTLLNTPDNSKLLNYTRYCKNCFLQTKCPEYDENNSCLLFEKIEIKNAEDIKKLLYTLLGVQTERALFAVFSEKIQGIPLDEKVTKEMLHLLEMLKSMKELSQENEELSIKAKGSGIISKLMNTFTEKKIKKSVNSKIIDIETNDD